MSEALAEWMGRAPELAAQIAERWSLELGERYHYTFVSLAVRAELRDGTPAVLEVAWPHPERHGEAAALEHYAGRGAVRLLAHDPELVWGFYEGGPIADHVAGARQLGAA